MTKLTVVGRRNSAADVLASLQTLGVVQIDPIETTQGGLTRLELRGDDRVTKEAWDAVVSRSASLLEALKVAETVTPPAKGDLPSGLKDIRAYVNDVGTQAEQLIAERGELRDDLELIGSYLPLFRQLAPSLGQLEESRYLYGAAFTLPADQFEKTRAALDEALEKRLVLTTKPYGRSLIVVAALLRKDQAAFAAALGQLGLSEVRLPERYAEHGVAKAVHLMEERSQSLPRRAETIDSELAQLAKQHGAKLRALSEQARTLQARYNAMQDLAEGRYSFALQGWLPETEQPRVLGALTKQFGDALVVDTRAADEHHDRGIPVKLDNPAWIRPFEGLLALFAPPQYGYFDPSWTLAVFFPLYFGLVVGDIGFGLLFLLLGLWLRARGAKGKALGLGPLGITLTPQALKPVGTVINWCASWSMVWGFLYGEFFGNFLERFPAARPVFYEPTHALEHDHFVVGMIPIALFRVERFTPLLVLCLGFGILQVLMGWVIRAYYGIRHGDLHHTFEGIGMFAGLSAIILFAYAFLSSAFSPLILTICAVGAVVFLLSAVIARMPLMLVEIISNSGNILSYLRLFAVGLSAALVANLATDLGFAIGGLAPVIGPIWGIIVAATVHLLAIALTIIGHTLQPLRLQYVEFFTKFGFYDESGRAYRPLRLFGGKA